MLVVQNNLAATYWRLRQTEKAMNAFRDVYLGRLKLLGEEYELTLTAANNYAASLLDLKRFEEAQSLMRKTIAVARRVLGGNHEFALKLKWCYAQSLYKDDGASLDDLCEAVATLEDVERTARRVFGGSHPLVLEIEPDLQIARAALHARDDACDYDEPD